MSGNKPSHLRWALQLTDFFTFFIYCDPFSSTLWARSIPDKAQGSSVQLSQRTELVTLISFWHPAQSIFFALYFSHFPARPRISQHPKPKASLWYSLLIWFMRNATIYLTLFLPRFSVQFTQGASNLQSYLLPFNFLLRETLNSWEAWTVQLFFAN